MSRSGRGGRGGSEGTPDVTPPSSSTTPDPAPASSSSSTTPDPAPASSSSSTTPDPAPKPSSGGSGRGGRGGSGGTSDATPPPSPTTPDPTPTPPPSSTTPDLTPTPPPSSTTPDPIPTPPSSSTTLDPAPTPPPSSTTPTPDPTPTPSGGGSGRGGRGGSGETPDVTTPPPTSPTPTPPAESPSPTVTRGGGSAGPRVTTPSVDLQEAARVEPSYQSYSNTALLLSRVDTTSRIRDRMTVTENRRSDPLGLYQFQAQTPMGYGPMDNNEDDSLGALTACRAESGFTGSCSSCLCRSDPIHARANQRNQRYGTDSFVVFCVQGEIWGSQEENVTEDDEDGQGESSQSVPFSNEFFGSSMYERTNFFTGTACVLHNELVGIPFGAKVLRVGLGMGWLSNKISSYFEEGGGKYVNFRDQKHHAGGLYQVASPVVEIQGTTKHGLVSLSISDKSSGSKFGAVMGLLLPPIMQKLKTYVHKKRRAELNLICNTVTMRVGHIYEGEELDWLKARQQHNEREIAALLKQQKKPKTYFYLPTRLSNWWAKTWVGTRNYRKRLKKRDRFGKKIKSFLAKIGEQDASPSLSVIGEQENSCVQVEVPWKKDEKLGGSHLTILADDIILGGSTMGPDIFVNQETQTIKLTVGPQAQGKELQQIVMTPSSSILKSVASMAASESAEADAGSRKSLLKQDTGQIAAQLEVANKEIILASKGPSGTGALNHMELKAGSLEINVPLKITLKIPKSPLTIEAGGKIEMKAPTVTLGNKTMTAVL